MKGTRKSKFSENLFAHTPANCLFEITNTKYTRQEIKEENVVDSPEEKNRRVSFTPEATPVTIYAAEDEFMVDSLNVPGVTHPSVTQESRNKERKLNSIAEEITDNNFMNALQTAINHFEDTNTLDKKHKQSPSFSNENTSNEAIRRQYNSLLIKYNELKDHNKKLMSDYASLRSEFEEAKAVL